jgi:benzoate membrane transport protein
MSDAARGGWLPALGAAIPLIILPIAVLSLPLAAADAMRLSSAQTASWILALYGLSAVVSILLSFRYRHPLLLTGNVFVLIFIASLGNQLSYQELIGASVVAGGCVLLLDVLGLTRRLAAWVPTPVVLGLLAGAIIPFVSGIFTALSDWPAPIGGALVAYLWGRHRLGARVPPVLPALVAVVAIAALAGDLGEADPRFSLPAPTLTAPVFSLEGIVTATPVLVVVMTLQSNVPSLIFLQNQGYQPPERVISRVSGVGTMLVSLLGPTALSLSLPVTSLVAGPDAGDREFRHRTVYIAGAAVLLMGLLAPLTAMVPTIVPLPLLLALAGLASVGVLAGALQQVTKGPLVLGPLFAFAVALSQISLLGLGPFFWSLVIGTGVSLWLEREEWRALRATAPD